MDVTCSQMYLHRCQDMPEGIVIYLNWAKIPEVAMIQIDFLFQGCRWKTFHALTYMVADGYNLSSEADEHDRDEFPR